MDDWKELDIANLPPDILVGDYEFKDRVKTPDRLSVLEHCKGGAKVFYRKRAQESPSHEEEVKKLIEDIKEGYDLKTAVLYLLAKSADIPPES